MAHKSKRARRRAGQLDKNRKTSQRIKVKDLCRKMEKMDPDELIDASGELENDQQQSASKR